MIEGEDQTSWRPFSEDPVMEPPYSVEGCFEVRERPVVFEVWHRWFRDRLSYPGSRIVPWEWAPMRLIRACIACVHDAADLQVPSDGDACEAASVQRRRPSTRTRVPWQADKVREGPAHASELGLRHWHCHLRMTGNADDRRADRRHRCRHSCLPDRSHGEPRGVTGRLSPVLVSGAPARPRGRRG